MIVNRTKLMKAIIVEDEPLSSMYLAALANQWCAEIDIVDQPRNIEDAILAMKQHLPNLIFLDIQLGYESGLSLLEFVKDNFPAIIITTALSHQATSIIQSSGVPYLQKPVDKDDLIEAVKKIKSISVHDFQMRAGILYQSFISGGFPKAVYADPLNEPGQMLQLEHIVVIESENDQTVFQTLAGKTIHAPNISFRLLQQVVDDAIFFSIDKQHVVNLNHIEQLIPSMLSLNLTGNLSYTLSVDKYERLTEVIQNRI